MTIKINYGKIYLSSVTWEIGVIKVRKKIIFLVITFMFAFLFSFSVNASIIDNCSISLGSDILKDVTPIVGDCTYLLGEFSNEEAPAYWIAWALDIMKYIAVIALLVFVTLDFLKAIASNDKDALKKAGTNAIRRFIYCVIIFFIPNIVEIIMELFGIAGYCLVG